ncbi:type II toxin-antitoxin system RelE family toxin [Saccharomonospora iraqiensis]|uniref:type II toxin-antitoxin system RelE family toxin n=1 Tax=Saccharomonospora iraqiensis TaxID=52698 RepID=UPI00022E6100|nr:type II toxin-antitoxin system RelE/ParE family toxin [Saccharomonospora iraqiensis]
MTYQIDLTRRAAKALDAIDKPQRRRVLAVIDALTDEPRPPRCTKLAGTTNQWRVRAGDYRVVYEVHDDRLLVLVVEVGHRACVYKDNR